MLCHINKQVAQHLHTSMSHFFRTHLIIAQKFHFLCSYRTEFLGLFFVIGTLVGMMSILRALPQKLVHMLDDLLHLHQVAGY